MILSVSGVMPVTFAVIVTAVATFLYMQETFNDRRTSAPEAIADILLFMVFSSSVTAF